MSAPTPGWNPDPSGRHEYRYWDGSTWTDDVSDNGVTSADPIGAAGGVPGASDPAPTAPLEPTQSYGQAPPPTGYGQPGPPSGGYPPAGPPSGGYPPAGPGGPGGYDPYGTGGMPPATPKKSPPTGLIVGGAILALALIIGLVVVLTSGGDDDDDTTTGSTTTTEDDTSDTTADDDTTTTEEDDTTTEGSESADVFALGVGDCITDETDMTGEVSEVPIIDCGQPHASEVFHSYMIPDTSLPDDAGIQAIVEEQCLPAFQTFVGLDYYESVLDVNYLSPTADSWEQAGDRELLCLVYDPAGDVTGSLAGANR